MVKEIKFRADLHQRTRDLVHKVESLEMLLRGLDKKMSDALHAGASSMTPPDLGALNDQRTAAWNDLRNAKKALQELTVEPV